MEIVRLIQRLRVLPVFNKRCKNKINVFISIFPHNKGGGSNTFVYNLRKWLLQNRSEYNLVYDICKADKAIVIANRIDIRNLEAAKKRGCFIIHRLDEHIEENEDEYRRRKHAYIKDVNVFSDITVYQSNFVYDNMHPFLGRPEKYEIILNGTHQDDFYPNETPGKYIGNITWGVGDKKRLDIVHEEISNNPGEHFLLIGNHSKSNYEFNPFSNVTYVGSVKRKKMLSLLHKMKFLFFPSENDPCPNTVVEAIAAGVPVCYNPVGGTKEIVKDCGLPISEFRAMTKDFVYYRQKCLVRKDLNFDDVAQKYMRLK